MPPKKTVPRNETVSTGRPPRSKITKDKPKLKVPSIIKIKIPRTNATKIAANGIAQDSVILTKKSKDLTTDDKLLLANTDATKIAANGIAQDSVILTKKSKDLTTDDKLQLANTVARAQLEKSETVAFPPKPEPLKVVKVVKKRGPRKKIVIEKIDDGSAAEVSVSAEAQVARAQLEKSETVAFPPEPEPLKVVKVVKKRGPRKKIVIEKIDDGSAAEVSVSAEAQAARAQIKSETVAFSPEPEPLKVVKVVKKRGPRKKIVIEKIDDGSATEVSVNAEAQSTRKKIAVENKDYGSAAEVSVKAEAQGTRKKIVIEKKDNGSATEVPVSAEAQEINSQPTTPGLAPKPKRKYVRNTPVNSMKKAPEKTVTKTALKRKLSNPTETPVGAKKPRRKWTQSRITDMTIVLRRSSIQSLDISGPKSDKSRTVTIKKPNVVRKPALRGKKKESKEDSILESPSILSQPLPPQAVPAIKEEADHETCKTASPIESRKTSFNSELSWTKDISDSSNITSLSAVTASDIVRIDNKLPVLALDKILPVLSSSSNINHSRPPSVEREFSPRTPSTSSSDTSSSDSDSDSVSTRCNSLKESEMVDVNSLNLSTSSESHRSPILTQKNIRINTMNSNVNKIDRALDKLAMSLKKIDMEIINWVGYQNEDININNKKIKDKIFQNLQEESNIILQCQHVNKLLSENEEIPNKEISMTANNNVQINDANFVKPSDITLPKTVNKTRDTNLDKASHSTDQTDHNESKFDVNENLALDNIPYVPFEQSLDDEDALSLYAESIGFESHRNSISSPPHNPTEFEEYIPQPVRNPLPTTSIVYNPTKINSNSHTIPVSVQNVKTVAMICEKQNADSTSVFREANHNMNHMEGIEKLPVPTNPNAVGVQIRKGPCLLASMFRPVHGSRSAVFKGMCFFHLIDSCKNYSRCRFQHIQPAPIEISARLARLSEEFFIQEYLLMKSWPGLRRKFGLCFINECKRRDLTRFLIEMAMDFVMKANQHSREDALLKTHVLEETLLVLNEVDLNTYEDLLKHVVANKQFCNIFMEAIADTQNFSRFKPVFIKLTEFIIGNKETFSANVAKHILERVVILPFEEPLAQAVINIIEHTDPVIFENSMMGQFEKQLASSQNLLGRFLEVKEKAGLNRMVVSPEFNPAVPPPVIRQEVEMMKSPLYPDRIQRYTSPDTTHLDPMKKPPDEPIITRTIHFNYSLPSINYSSSSSESMDEYPRTPKPNSLFKSWRDKTTYNKLTPQQRSPNKRRTDRQVSYAIPSKFPRRPRPY